MAVSLLEPSLIVLAVLLLLAAGVALLRRDPRVRPRVDRAIERYWDTEQHSDAWAEEERDERERHEPPRSRGGRR